MNITKVDMNDKKSILEYLNQRMFRHITPLDLRQKLDERLSRPGNKHQKEVLRLLRDSMDDLSFYRLWNDPVDGPNSFERLEEIFKTLHYDNGLPLTGINYPEQNPTEYNDYFFDHFDRDEDFYTFFEYDYSLISYDFDSNGNLIGKLAVCFDSLKRICTEEYEGSSWDHDFNGSDEEDEDEDFDECVDPLNVTFPDVE